MYHNVNNLCVREPERKNVFYKIFLLFFMCCLVSMPVLGAHRLARVPANMVGKGNHFSKLRLRASMVEVSSPIHSPLVVPSSPLEQSPWSVPVVGMMAGVGISGAALLLAQIEEDEKKQAIIQESAQTIGVLGGYAAMRIARGFSPSRALAITCIAGIEIVRQRIHHAKSRA
jgi:hypothetical protein